MRSKRLAHESLRIITAFVIKITASDNLLLKDKRASFEIHSEKGHVSSHLPSHDLFRLLTNISFKSLPVENHNWKCFAIYEHEKPEICIFFFINLNLTMYSIFNKNEKPYKTLQHQKWRFHTQITWHVSWMTVIFRSPYREFTTGTVPHWRGLGLHAVLRSTSLRNH